MRNIFSPQLVWTTGLCIRSGWMRRSKWRGECARKHFTSGAGSSFTETSAASVLDDVGLVDTDKLPRLYVGPPPEYAATLDDLFSSPPTPHNNSRPNILYPNATLPLSIEQSHYLQTVLRFNSKTAVRQQQRYVRLWDDQQQEYLASILPMMAMQTSKNSRRQQQKQQLVAQCLHALSPTSSSGDDGVCYLAVALPKKKDRCRWLVEKTTELGCAGFVWLDTEYSETSHGHNNKKLLVYAMEAAEQCERITLPRMKESMTLTRFLEQATKTDVTIKICRERKEVESSRTTTTPENNDKYSPTVFVIGPEGGWSPAECKMLNEFDSVSLGRTILRTETASVAAVATFMIKQ